MSVFTKIFAAIKSIHIGQKEVDEATQTVDGIKGIVALIEADLADGKLSASEVFGLVMAVLDLVNIFKKTSAE